MSGGKTKQIFIGMVFLLTFFFGDVAYALENDPLGISPPIIKCGDPSHVIDDEIREKLQIYRDTDADFFERNFVDVIDTGFSLFNLNSLANLFYGNPYCGWADEEDDEVPALYYGIFTEFEMNTMITSITTIFGTSYFIFVLIAFLIIGLRMQVQSFSPQGRNDFWEDIKMLFFSAFLMVAIFPILHFLLYLNHAFLLSLRTYMEGAGIDLHSFSVLNTNAFDSFFLVIAGLAEWTLATYLNLVYFFRKILIVLIFMLAPLACISLLYPTTRAFFTTWARDLTGLIFLQSIHGLLFFFILMFNDLYGTHNLFVKLVLLALFIPITGVFTQMFRMGDSSNLSGQAANAMGIGALYRSAKLLKSTGSHVKGLGSAMRGSKLTQTAQKTRISSIAQGEKSKAWQGVKHASAKVGAGTGAMIGSPLGPVGVAAGAAIGSKVTPALVQVGRNASVGASSTVKTIKEALNYNGSNGKGIKGAISNLQERRRISGNLGESVGSIVGAGGTGRKVGEAASGVSNRRLLEAPLSQGGYGGMMPKDLARLHPNQTLQWRQTNEGSAFFLLNESGELGRQVSPMGEADTHLRNGEVRSMDYRLGGESALRKNENGLYTAPAGGFAGSTPDLQRVSNPIIRDANGNRFNDPRVDGKDINPDSYFAHGITNTPSEHGSDKAADQIGAWYQKVEGRRHNGVT
ncbi:hypothetical protein BpOF4_20604 (plasmid) [Alkalihalophilus pseudofirmus OF4]|uniref:Uncharacterized protein n=2 Tax=Bacillaceae TaxID=186817 RepID=D3G190_ALKPO|nr:O-antigen polymerase [Alkalihalophilus pseudofirmus]ADC52116.1 hypothetical protein BpOF4_20604 [Alkalihalophilus pseudofirmus OF4]